MSNKLGCPDHRFNPFELLLRNLLTVLHEFLDSDFILNTWIMRKESLDALDWCCVCSALFSERSKKGLDLCDGEDIRLPMVSALISHVKSFVYPYFWSSSSGNAIQS